MEAATSPAERTGSVTPLPGAARPDRLPRPLTSFVGREHELEELRAALIATRLLSLTGPGGCGKTRLALRLAADSLGRFQGEVWWVELGSIADERLVGAAVAATLEVRPPAHTTPLRAACTYLAPRRALVVFDNCEHLRDGCAAAAGALLATAPEVVVVATSRAPLGVDGETDWRVPPLSEPDAVSLFAERARKARPGFVLGDGATVARVCAELDGLPLAIELAAARVRILSVAQIATELTRRFRLLTGGPRTAAERQRTLRASLEWSHALLRDDEITLLRRLSVFSGAVTLPDIEQVCGIDSERLLDVLASLVDQSLVIATEQGAGMRYRLSQTMREFAHERLVEAGEELWLRARHRDAFLALAEEAAPHLETGRQHEWLERLDSEAAELASAIDHALGTGATPALRFCAALYRWWGGRGRFGEADRAATLALDACGDDEPALRARVLHGRAYLAVWAGDLEAADAHATEALALAERAGDRATAARARCDVAAARHFADPRAARADLARAAELARPVGDDWALGTAAWLTVSTYMWQSDHRRAAHANDELTAVAERLGDPFLLARRWLYVAWMACLDGRFAEARGAIERQRAAVAAVGEPVMEALADHFLAFADTYQGDPGRSLERQLASLERASALGAGSVVPWMTIDVALAELALGRPDRARDRLETVLGLVTGRFAFATVWALWLLAEAQRLLGDGRADATALRAEACGERLGNRLYATSARLTRGRIAAARGDWPAAREHALAHLEACVAGGHATYVPGCLDALAEVAAGLHRHVDAARLLGAADRARAELGTVRLPPEHEHWAALEHGLRAALGDAYTSARAEGDTLSSDEALEWARRANGARGRGWGSLTSTEAKVVELASEGLTNRQIAERMFVSPETVKTHLSHVFAKLGVRGRTELAARHPDARRNPPLGG